MLHKKLKTPGSKSMMVLVVYDNIISFSLKLLGKMNQIKKTAKDIRFNITEMHLNTHACVVRVHGIIQKKKSLR